MRVWPLILLVLPSSCALDVPDESGRTRAPIVGGNDVGACAWPSVVALESPTGPCSGTLVHREIVVFAAHCMSNGNLPPTRAHFGERVSQPAFSVEIETCRADPSFPGNPDVGVGHDLAYCRLARAVDQVPIVPVLTRCETPDVKAGDTVTAVGFGLMAETSDDDGVKRAVDLDVHEIVGNEVHVGGGARGTCNGDSGGPMFLALPSGEFRLFAVTSWAPGACGEGEYAALVQSGYDWLASSSGVDLTARSPLHPAVQVGSWPDACGDGALSESKASCDVMPSPESESASSGCAFAHHTHSSSAGWLCFLISLLVLSGRRPEGFRVRAFDSSSNRGCCSSKSLWHEHRSAASHALVTRSARSPDRSGVMRHATGGRHKTEAA